MVDVVALLPLSLWQLLFWSPVWWILVVFVLVFFFSDWTKIKPLFLISLLDSLSCHRFL